MSTVIPFNEDDISILREGSLDDCSAVMNTFITNNEKRTSFEELSLEIKKSLYEGIFLRISDPTTAPVLVNILLSSLRILCRELSTLDVVLTDDQIQILLKVSGLNRTEEFQHCSVPVQLEGLKVIFNMTFQSALLRSKFVSNGILEYLVGDLELLRELPLEIKYFRMRILFIMTALLSDCVARVREDLNGLNIILDDLGSIASAGFDDPTMDVICEMLKVAYNLMHNFVPKNTNETASCQNEGDEYGDIQKKAINLVKQFLLLYVKAAQTKDSVQSHSIDLLAVIPHELFDELIDDQIEESEFNYDGHDMGAVESLVIFLDGRLGLKPGYKTGTMIELLSPILCVLIRMAATNRLFRKYLKLRILPPLTKADVLSRPEVGCTLRNKLCALMTSSAGGVSNLVCSLLFILVKENVQRLVKYTGFGNAAGLLANRGLLGGAKAQTAVSYSSESEDSDTSEYKEVSHLINGFGWIEPEHPPPCAGMTEEQKEVEAMKLVDAIDKLNRNQLIQPVQIGRDGRVETIEHVCQLLEHSSDSLVRSSHRLGSDSSDST